MGEHLLDVQRVRGSNPLASTIVYLRSWRNWIAHLIPIQKVAGSSPVERAMNLRWGCSSAGRALRWQRRGRGFEPLQLHQTLKNKSKFVDFLFSFHTYITMIVYDNLVQGINTNFIIFLPYS